MPPEAEEKKETSQPKSGSKKLIILIAIVAVLLAGGGAGAYFFFFKGSGGEQADSSKKEKEHENIVQEMDTFLVNLVDPGGKRFLKITMKMKLSSPPAQEEFKNRQFEMRDLVLMLLTSKEYDEVSKPEDKVTLKKDILASLNKVMHKGQVLDVYFTDFLVQ